MTKEPFTQELLLEVYERHGLVTVELLQDVLPSWTDKDIKKRMSVWRSRRAIRYTLVGDEFGNFEYLRDRPEELAELDSKTTLTVALDYYDMYKVAERVSHDPTATIAEVLTANKQRLQAYSKIPKKLIEQIKEIYGE